MLLQGVYGARDANGIRPTIHPPGIYEMPAYVVCGDLQVPRDGGSWCPPRITLPNGSPYPHPHAGGNCWGHGFAGISGAVVPNDLGMDNRASLHLLWTRDILRCVYLIRDYLMSWMDGYDTPHYTARLIKKCDVATPEVNKPNPQEILLSETVENTHREFPTPPPR
jgi:hypothetical protein